MEEVEGSRSGEMSQVIIGGMRGESEGMKGGGDQLNA